MTTTSSQLIPQKLVRAIKLRWNDNDLQRLATDLNLSVPFVCKVAAEQGLLTKSIDSETVLYWRSQGKSFNTIGILLNLDEQELLNWAHERNLLENQLLADNTTNELKAYVESFPGEFNYADLALHFSLPLNTVVNFIRSNKLTDCLKQTHSINEDYIEGILLRHFSRHEVVTQYPLGGGQRLDLFLPSKRIGIEYDGELHFVYVEGLHKDRSNFLRGQDLDKKKELLCTQQLITLVRFDDTDQPLTEELVMKRVNDTGVLHAVEDRNQVPDKADAYKEKQRAYRRDAYRRSKEQTARRK